MANFLEDNSNLSAAAGFLKGATEAYQDAEDRRMKRMELESQIKTQEEQRQRNKMLDQLSMKQSGYQQGEDGSLQEAPLSGRQQDAQDLSTFEKGVRSSGERDENGHLKLSWDPTSPQAIGARNKGVSAANGAGRIDTQRDAQAAAAANKIHHDPVLTQMTQQARNIDKGLDLLQGQPSFTALNEVAQDFSAALSGKAVSSDFKLRELQTPAVAAEIAKLKAYASSNPDQPATPEMVKFWHDMGQRLNDAYGRQMGARASGQLKGLKTAYAHNANAYNAAVEAARSYADGSWRSLDSSDLGNIQAPAATAPPPDGAGLVKEQPGLLSRLGGLLGMGKAEAAAPAAVAAHPQDQEALAWAQAHPNDLARGRNPKSERG
jgi:hypothetical protein